MLDPELVAARTVDEAVEALQKEDALVLGGGTAMAVLLRAGLASPSRLVWLGRVEELKAVRRGLDGSLVIGAGVTIAEMARSPQVGQHSPALSSAAARVANPRIRSVATLGGHLGHADPRQDLPPVLLSLDARVVTASPSGGRELRLDELFAGFMETALADDEIIRAVVIPQRNGHLGSYVRYSPMSADDFPTVGAAVELQLGADDRVSAAKVAVGAVGPMAVVVPEAARVLVGEVPGRGMLRRLEAAVRDGTHATDDQRGSAAYKQAMAGLMTRRAVALALGRTDLLDVAVAPWR